MIIALLTIRLICMLIFNIFIRLSFIAATLVKLQTLNYLRIYRVPRTYYSILYEICTVKFLVFFRVFH